MSKILFSKKHQDNESKMIARDIVLGAKQGEIKNIISLPSKGYVFEDKVLKIHPKCQFICAENNPEIYSQMKKKKKNVKLFNDDIFNVAKNHRHIVFDIAWFDLCGSLTPTIQNEFIKYVLSDSFSKGCVAAITFSFGRYPSNKFIVDHSGCHNREDYYRDFFTNNVIDFAKAVNKQVEVYNYLSYSESSPMHVITFKHN